MRAPLTSWLSAALVICPGLHCLLADGSDSVGAVVIDGEAVVYRTDMPRQWENALRPMGKASSPMVLADRGKTEYVLVTPKNAKETEVKAARDIAQYFKLISGAAFPIVGEEAFASKGGPFISIGRTTLLEGSRCQWKRADLAAEGYAVEVIGNNVYLYGGSGRGLINGVYSLLEEDLGCRWYAPTSIDTPCMERFSVSFAPRRVVPVLESRCPHVNAVEKVNWAVRNKTHIMRVPFPSACGESTLFYHTNHTDALYFPPKEYFAEHPEYYALVNGQRRPKQLCHTNEDVIRLSIEKTCKIFRDNPDVTVTSIAPNDGRGLCDCPHCRKLDDENGGRSGSIFHFVNRIAEGVKKEFPNRHLMALAYMDYAKPPTKLKVDPSVIVRPCTDSHAWKYQFCFVWESPDFQKMLKGWQAANVKMYIWDYTTDFVHYLVPLANWPVVAENARFYIKHGAAGIMYQCNASDNDEMRGWVWAKQLWNPDLDTKALLKDFVFGYYKESAQPLWDHEMMMWDYWEKWHRVPHQCGAPSDNPLLNNLQCSYAPDGPMFTPDFMAKMRKCLAEAESRARSADVLARVKKAKMPLLYLDLSQNLGYYSEFGDFVYGKRIRDSRAKRQTFKPILDEFMGLCKKNKVARLREGPITFEKVIDKWQACIDMETPSLSRLDLPAEWVFAADPKDRGIREKWYANRKLYDALIGSADEYLGGVASSGGMNGRPTRLHINRGVGWEQQGFPDFDGYGWYFQNIEVPDELFAKKHLYLYLRGVNEQAWVYVNGKYAFERTYASTGKCAGELSGATISFDLKEHLKAGRGNRIAIRVTHSLGLGGISMPAMLIGTEKECTTKQLGKFRS